MLRTIRFAIILLTLMIITFYMSKNSVFAQTQAYTLQTIASGIDHPWRVALLPDERLLVTSRAGPLWIIGKDGAKTQVSGVPEILVSGQGGLFEAVPHPQFSENRWIFLVYAHGTSRQNGTRVARAKLEGESLRDLQVLFTVSPLKADSLHFGGRLVFLPDGTFVLTTGDGYRYRDQAQDLSSLLGKIVRLNADGSIPQDNPYRGQQGARGEIWSYGHRNPQGLFYDASTGTLYANEHGARGGDEINIIEKGKNYGWPVLTKGVDYSGARIAQAETRPGMEQPTVDWTPSIAPSSLIVYSGKMFPQWKGDLLSTALVDQNVRRVRLENRKPIQQESLFKEIGERLRDIREAPDGALYIATDDSDGKIIKVTAR